jgi:hypothetical protein
MPAIAAPVRDVADHTTLTPAVLPERRGPARVALTDIVDDVDAVAGAIEVNTPKPNADTATSAMRLRSVFVDICFLSISQNQEFPDLGFG